MIRLEARINGTELSLEADELIGGDEAERYLATWTTAVDRVLAASAGSSAEEDAEPLHPHQGIGAAWVPCKCSRCRQHAEKQHEWNQPGGHVVSADQLA